MKTQTIALTALFVGIAASASATQLKGTPYTFTGSVVSATAGCPYAAKAALAGYTLINPTYEYLPPNYNQQVSGISGPALIFSPGGDARKLIMKLANLPNHSGFIAGKAATVLLPTTTVANGTYTGSIDLKADRSFSLLYTLTYKNAGTSCTTKLSLAFAKGLPTNLYKLL